MEILITQIVEIIKEMELNSFGFSFIVLSIFIFLAVIDSEKEDKGDEDRFTIEFNKNSGKIDKFLMCFSYFLLIQTLLIFLAIIFFLIKDEYALAFGSLVLFVPICFALIVVSASRFPYRDAKKLKQMAKEFTTE